MDDFLSVDDLSRAEFLALLDLADELKASRGSRRDDLGGRTVALVFEKPSTRTRVSFEVAVHELGGHALSLSGVDLQIGRGETIADTGTVLSRYVHAIVLRTFEQSRLTELAAAATVPVVNALSDHEHPCQALADLQTIRAARGALAGVSLAYVGDGNNVAHSLLLAGALVGMSVRVATPAGYEPGADVVSRARELAASSGGEVLVTDDPRAAAADADVVYTDVWASMGQEAEAKGRARTFAPYQVDTALMAVAAPHAIFLHCLPAHRGEEVAAEVMDGSASRVFDQAENRLHTEKALLLQLLPPARAT